MGMGIGFLDYPPLVLDRGGSKSNCNMKETLVTSYKKTPNNAEKRLGQKSQPLNCFWIVEQDAVVEWGLLG
ncbi:hypothetical protein STRDD13_01616 [Streptococcus sp. DD13]|nr:hypothetical protein STRDD13_01616 [Streptococcus sp. DD13]